MRYDPDMARLILKAMEAHELDQLHPQTNLLPDLDNSVYFSHCRLLSEAGFISVYEMRMSGGLNFYWPRELKWAGVQFLQMFKEETLWQRTKNEATTKGVGLALDTLMDVGTRLITKIISSQVA